MLSSNVLQSIGWLVGVNALAILMNHEGLLATVDYSPAVHSTTTVKRHFWPKSWSAILLCWLYGYLKCKSCFMVLRDHWCRGKSGLCASHHPVRRFHQPLSKSACVYISWGTLLQRVSTTCFFSSTWFTLDEGRPSPYTSKSSKLPACEPPVGVTGSSGIDLCVLLFGRLKSWWNPLSPWLRGCPRKGVGHPSPSAQ